MRVLKIYAALDLVFLAPFLVRGLLCWRAELRFWRRLALSEPEADGSRPSAALNSILPA